MLETMPPFWCSQAWIYGRGRRVGHCWPFCPRPLHPPPQKKSFKQRCFFGNSYVFIISHYYDANLTEFIFPFLLFFKEVWKEIYLSKSGDVVLFFGRWLSYWNENRDWLLKDPSINGTPFDGKKIWVGNDYTQELVKISNCWNFYTTS